jgi:hypothetical protein
MNLTLYAGNIYKTKFRFLRHMEVWRPTRGKNCHQRASLSIFQVNVIGCVQFCTLTLSTSFFNFSLAAARPSSVSLLKIVYLYYIANVDIENKIPSYQGYMFTVVFHSFIWKLSSTMILINCPSLVYTLYIY